MPPFNYWLYAFPAFIIGLSPAIILGKFFFPALLFFLVYALTRELVGEDEIRGDTILTSIAAGLLVVFGYEFINYQYIIPALRGLQPVIPIIWTRPVNPIGGALAVFACMTLFFQLWRGRCSWKYIFATGIMLALSAGYYFSFGMCMAVLGSLGVIALARKEFSTVRSLLYVAIISFVLDSWYWWSVLSLQGDPETATRNGMLFSHAPHLNKFLLLSTVIVGALFAFTYIWRRQKGHPREWLFIAALIVGSWITLNEQVLTGREIWYYHFVQYTIPLAMVSILVAAHFAFRKSSPKLWQAALYLLCTVIMLYGLFSVTSYRFHTDDFSKVQSYAPLFTWLEQNAPDNCAVYVTGNEYNGDTPQLLIPAYTHCDAYNPPAPEYISPDRLMHNYFLRLKIDGLQPSQLQQYLLAHEAEVRSIFFDTWQEQTPSGADAWFLGKVDWLVAQYPAFYAGDLKGQLLQYRMNYFVSTGPIPASLLEKLSGLTLRAHVDTYDIYSF